MSLIYHARLACRNGARYIPLLQNLISRELKKKYRKSVLSYLWCVMNPLFVMLITNFVFSHMFRSNIENYPVYLFAGRMMFSFITDSTTSVSRSIISNGALMRKTRVPYYIFPTATFCSSIVNFSFTLIAFAIVLAFTGTPVTIHIIAFPLVLIELFMFSYGLGLLLSQINTIVRDVGYIYGVLTTAWMYFTPLFYPLQNLPEATQQMIKSANIAYFYVAQSRSIFLYHEWPDPNLLLRGGVVGVVMLMLGLFVYSRMRDKLIYYV